MDRTVLQLSAICLVACLCLALAWAHEADYFAMFFRRSSSGFRRGSYPQISVAQLFLCWEHQVGDFPRDGPRAGARIASQCGGEPDEFRLIQVMKTLFPIRHAKSSWDDPALSDKDRPLSDRGRHDAPKMGKRLAKRDVKPDLILSSPARRALTTAEIIAKKLDYKLKDIVVNDRLYAGAVHSLLNVIHGLGDKPERVMLFGHNPELTEFAHRLSGEITHMPTCAVAEFTFSAKSWQNIGKANLARVALDYPKKKKS